MTELLRCERCGNIFNLDERTGPTMMRSGDIMRHAARRTCPLCGGTAESVDEAGSPMHRTTGGFYGWWLMLSCIAIGISVVLIVAHLLTR
jgi:hypothetical protein